MSRRMTDKTYVPLGLSHYYLAGISKEDALKFLLKSHENSPNIVHKVDICEVNFWYESFKNKNFDLDQHPIYPERSQLLNLPVIETIIHKVGASDQKNLRKVCSQLRVVIDNEDRLYEKIHISLSTSGVAMIVKCRRTQTLEKIIFAPREGGCQIIQGDTRSESKKSFLEETMLYFGKKVGKMHTKVEQMIVSMKQNGSVEEVHDLFMLGIANTLSTLKEKLSVQDLEVTCNIAGELDAILKGIMPGSLNKLKIVGKKYDERLGEVISLSPHLRYLVELNSVSITISIPLLSVCHIPDLLISIREFTIEEFRTYKTKLLESTVRCVSHHIVSLVVPRLRGDMTIAMEPYTGPVDMHGEPLNNFSGSIPLNNGSLHFKFSDYLKVKLKRT